MPGRRTITHLWCFHVLAWGNFATNLLSGIGVLLLLLRKSAMTDDFDKSIQLSKNFSAHGSACSCCAGDRSYPLADGSAQSSERNDGSEAAQRLRSEWIEKPSASPAFDSKTGLDLASRNGKFVYTYRADGVEHKVAEVEATAAGRQLAEKQIRDLSEQKMADLQKLYKVSFAVEGEPVRRSYTLSAECQTTKGAMVHATTPNLRQLHAIELALKQSQPSQLADGTDKGIKFYFADSRIMPQVYGGRWPLGVHIHADKDGQRAMIITPDGAKTAATDKDAKPGERNLKWIVSHELTHNSQDNMWEDAIIPESTVKDLGWSMETIEKDGKVVHQYQFSLHGKYGEFYRNFSKDCASPSAWYRTNENLEPLDKEGGIAAKDLHNAETFTNEEVMERAKTRPMTYYFGNPREMHSEGLTAFRYNTETRRNLLNSSPDLYKNVSKYDHEEIAKFYGVDKHGRSNFLRLPSGEVKRRSPLTELMIKHFELEK